MTNVSPTPELDVQPDAQIRGHRYQLGGKFAIVIFGKVYTSSTRKYVIALQQR